MRWTVKGFTVKGFTCGEGELEGGAYGSARSSAQGRARALAHKRRGTEQRAPGQPPATPAAPGHFRYARGHLINRLGGRSPTEQQRPKTLTRSDLSHRKHVTHRARARQLCAHAAQNIHKHFSTDLRHSFHSINKDKYYQ